MAGKEALHSINPLGERALELDDPRIGVEGVPIVDRLAALLVEEDEIRLS
jgi:hypothetical protein